jgi:hypothetical protein
LLPFSRTPHHITQTAQASDAAAADAAHLKWLQLESERQQTRADALQSSLKSMRQQGAQLNSRVQQLEVCVLIMGQVQAVRQYCFGSLLVS